MNREIKFENYDKPIEIAEGIYWVGYADVKSGFHCNPYLIIEGEEALIIDGGSRNDFSNVMMKILQTGINPNNINRLIYQHYDPDLCGSVPHLESIIDNNDLKIISHYENNIFINYYSSTAEKLCIENLNFTYEFKTGRKLEFIRTPYAHSAGSFITYDCKTKTVFSSDIFGSYDEIWDLYLNVWDRCLTCNPETRCNDREHCPINGIKLFHKRIMTSTKALNYALDKIEELDIDIIAPQHGSIIKDERSRKNIIAVLRKLNDIGIDWVV